MHSIEVDTAPNTNGNYIIKTFENYDYCVCSGGNRLKTHTRTHIWTFEWVRMKQVPSKSYIKSTNET